MDDNKANSEITGTESRLRHLFASDAAKQIAIVVVIALVLLAVLWIWKSLQIQNIENRNSAERSKIEKNATSELMQSHENHLKLLAKPFVWAVRTEMLSGNLKQVNLYAEDMIREKNLQKIIVTDDKGIVLLSTNKKDQGKGYAFIGNPTYLLANTTLVDTINDSTMVMSSPVMGFNSRLGTLIVTYSFQPPVFDK